MSRAEEYRRCAAECLAIAQRASDPADRALLIEMANAFNELAARVAARDKTGDPEPSSD